MDLSGIYRALTPASLTASHQPHIRPRASKPHISLTSASSLTPTSHQPHIGASHSRIRPRASHQPHTRPRAWAIPRLAEANSPVCKGKSNIFPGGVELPHRARSLTRGLVCGPFLVGKGEFTCLQGQLERVSGRVNLRYLISRVAEGNWPLGKSRSNIFPGGGSDGRRARWGSPIMALHT